MVPADAPDFVRTVTAEMLAGRGDDLPVSALPVDGTYPSGTAAYEKRNISDLVAAWDADLCIQCGNCSFVCPHSVIRSKYYDGSLLDGGAGRLRVCAARRRRVAGCTLHASGLSRGLHRLRALRRGLPGLCSGRPGSQGDQSRCRASRCSRASARTSPSSRRFRQRSGRESTSAPSAGPSSWNRCSSSRARAQGVARRPTSSSSRSSSATG